MPLAAPNVKYRSGNFAVATAVGLPEFEQPFPGQPYEYVLKQKFQQNINDYAPLALNTEHPDFAGYYLVSESEPKSDKAGLIVEWTRVYAFVPLSYTEPGGTFNYTVIAFAGQTGVNITTIAGRPARPVNLECQLQHEFFIVGPGHLYATWEEIPVIQPTKYVFDYNALNPIYDNDNFPVGEDGLSDNPPFAVATIPSRTDYETLIATDKADPTSFSIIAEVAIPERWMGNIYRVTSKRVKAF